VKKKSTAKTKPEIAFERGSGDVWIDLGFTPAEASNLRMRSSMMMALDDFITRNKLTQARAAKLLRVSQPRISDLMRGHIDRFTLDTLVKMVVRAGLEVDLRIKTPSRRAA
jgi:predicted XRE-type DNA-binding protein